MTNSFDPFVDWIEERSHREPFFSGTFWLLFSTLSDPDLLSALRLDSRPLIPVPLSQGSTTVTVRKRTGRTLQAIFNLLPLTTNRVRILFSLDKPGKALRPMYHLLGRTKGTVHLFPIGLPLFKSCSRLSSHFSFADTHIVRGVSYPSRPSEGGADINLSPGNATTFFAKLEEEKRVLKTARLQVPTSEHSCCEFTVGRPGYVSYHKGDFRSLLKLITEKLPTALSDSIKPFERARGNFVQFRFADPLFVDRANYQIVLEALSRLPRTSLALIHTNPYFHATLTNYEDGGEFDIFITGHSTIHIQGLPEASPASFLRIQNGLTDQFQDASISLEQTHQYDLRQLMEGQV